MVTVSHLVKKIVDDRPLLVEGIQQGIISFGGLAEQLIPQLEQELGKKVKESAVVMALRRYADTLQKPTKSQRFDFNSEIMMKTGLCDVCVVKSPTIFSKLKSIYAMVDYQRGDVLNVIHGNNEVSIVTNEKYEEKLMKELHGEKVINKKSGLVGLSLNYGKEFYTTPGILSTIIRKLSWENVNIFEIVSTMTELTFVISDKDAIRGYNALQRLIKNE